jgi:2-keto-3-deoxy-L-fuconate dehydrogenase
VNRDRPTVVLKASACLRKRLIAAWMDSPSLADRIAKQAAAQAVSVEDVRKAFISRQPMERLGKPQEIAALAVYLASDESAFTTGQIHVIDGGITA